MYFLKKSSLCSSNESNKSYGCQANPRGVAKMPAVCQGTLQEGPLRTKFYPTMTPLGKIKQAPGFSGLHAVL